MNKKLLALILILVVPALNLYSQKKLVKAPDFALTDLEDKVVRLSQFKGKFIILDFWATWCPPCRAEIPSFIKLQEEYKDKGVLIIGIAVSDPINKVRNFAKDKNINYVILIGNDKVVKDYGGIRGIPTTFIINEKGEILEKYVGFKEEEIFVSHIKDFIARSETKTKK